jgi:mono/diheme cytochrome c family protein
MRRLRRIATLAAVATALAGAGLAQAPQVRRADADPGGGGVAIGPATAVLPTADVPAWRLDAAGAERVATADAASADPVVRGRYLAAVGDCADCHTNPGAQPYSGARPLRTSFGVFYSANLTPDRQTGIGAWTDDQFYRAMHTGVRNDGARLYPAFPFTSFTHVSRADADALRAYLATQAPVDQRPPPNRVPFPLNLRVVMLLWDWLFFRPAAPFEPDPSKSAEWNRGAYIVQGLGHCSGCHTPRNFLGAERAGQALEGGVNDDWAAPNLTGETRVGLGSWSKDELVQYLRAGRNDRATATGAMTEVIYFSTSRMRDADLGAIATYLKDLPAAAVAASASGPDPAAMRAGAAIYADACAACHRGDALGVPTMFPTLQGSASVQGRDPTTIVRIILEGTRSVPTPTRPTPLAMPAFAWKLDDDEVASLATYIRNAWGNAAPPVSAGQVQHVRRRLTIDQNPPPPPG